MNSSELLHEPFSLLKKDESHLKHLTEKYPWCSLSQLYLLHQFKKNHSSEFDKQAQKTALFFKNANWLNFQLALLAEEAKDQQQEIKINQEISPENIVVEDKLEKQNNLIPVTPDTNADEDIIPFEPLHTVDYFASQGIKITEEPVTNDKLGNQMKSFTEWLKSMKKIHKENLPAGDEQTDKTIQRLAEHSNEAAEVVTESMADVLIKQGKTDKAIEVYEKLSLQNPSKSAYFAAKINALKAT
jgi:hypothetical protein